MIETKIETTIETTPSISTTIETTPSIPKPDLKPELKPELKTKICLRCKGTGEMKYIVLPTIGIDLSPSEPKLAEEHTMTCFECTGKGVVGKLMRNFQENWVNQTWCKCEGETKSYHSISLSKKYNKHVLACRSCNKVQTFN